MKATLEAESTLTDRYQTTVPTSVRQALKLDRRDRVHYAIRPDGSVLLSRAAERDAEDPVMSGFLDFLTRDMHVHPQRLQVLGSDFAARVRGLVKGVEVDLDAPLSTADE
jgi:antitoxin PrlF